VSTPALLPRPDRERFETQFHPRPIPTAIPTFSSATSTLENGHQHWRISPPCCSPRCRPSPPTTCSGSAAPAAGCNALVAPIRHRHPPRPLLLSAEAGGDAARPRQPTGCYPMRRHPAGGQLLAFHPGRLGAERHRCPRPCLASSNPPSMRGREGGQRRTSRPPPLHLLQLGQAHQASCWSAFCSSSPTSWLTPPNRRAAAIHSLPGEAPLERSHAQRADPAAFENLIARAQTSWR